jgi:transposase, IS5 family
MKPRRSSIEDPQKSLFDIELEKIIDPRQPLARLAERMDWRVFDERFGQYYHPTQGRPGNATRLMVGLHYLKYTYDLSDEEVVERWMENPYWQYFCGKKYFEYKSPIDPTSMTRWRKKVGVEGAEELLKETVATAMRMKAVEPKEFKNINVDTTVQEKAITYPTDSKLYYRMRARLVALAKREGVQLRQSYVRKARQALINVNRYFHARQHKRAHRQVKKLKTYLRRVHRDIVRKIAENQELQAVFHELLSLSTRLFLQERSDSNKLYSIHAPETECIGKGKAHKKYEFGNKVSVVSTSKKGLIIGMKSFHGNPYDGHTLADSMKQAEHISGRVLDGNIFVDRGYRKHDYQGPATVHIAKTEGLSRSLRRWMRRRSAIEAKIGHLKFDSRLDRNFLLGKDGDHINALLSGCGINFRFLLAEIYLRLYFLLFSAQLRLRRACQKLISALTCFAKTQSSPPVGGGKGFFLGAHAFVSGNI